MKLSQSLIGMVFVVTWMAGHSNACNIPVFRYALENWRPDPYHVFVVHQGPLDEPSAAAMQQLLEGGFGSSGVANYVVHDLDLAIEDAASSQAGRDLPQHLVVQVKSALEKEPLTSPRIMLFYPVSSQLLRPCWQADLTTEQVAAIVDSPLRQQIADQVLDGASAVWVLVNSGKPDADQEAYARLESELKRMHDVVQLPDQNLIETDEFFRPEVEIELKVGFELVRIDRNDPNEAVLAAMLLGSEPDLLDFDEPIAVPIYGRGRTYYALVGKGINAAMIEDSCRFICGACSCQVKQENPGVDLLVALDWDQNVVGSAMPEVELPALTGIGGFENQEQLASTATTTREPTLPDIHGDEGGGESEAAESSLSEGEGYAAHDASHGAADSHGTDHAASTPRGIVDGGQRLFLTMLSLVGLGLIVVSVATVVVLRRHAKST